MLAALTASAPRAVAAPDVRVPVCHLNEEGGFHRIEVSRNAVPGHLRHGDALPGAGELDAECDPVVVPFVDEDFEDGLPGQPVDGTGCWDCQSGPCDETFSADTSVSGTQALETAGTHAAQLFCTDSGFGADFAFETWMYDTGQPGGSLTVYLQAAPSENSVDNVFIGHHSFCGGDADYCAASFIAGVGPVALAPLGARSVGWHHLEVEAIYSGATSVDWTICLDGACGGLATTTFAVGTFRLGHNDFHAYFDDFLAVSL